MAKINTDISICAAALQLIGADEITSFYDETREARLCASLYDTLKQDTLQSHPWGFSVRQEQLNQLVKTPLYGFSYAYSLPTDFLRLIGKDNPSYKHQLFENRLYTNLETVYAKIQYDVSERYFPSYFVLLLQFKLAGMLASAVLEDENKTDKFLVIAREQMIKARNIDSQNNSNLHINSNAFNLTNVRF